MFPSRRTVLSASALSVMGTALPTRAHASVRLTRESRRVVVVGSGFGGGVAALRLARAGVPVTVLERGRRWPTGPNAETFPHAGRPDRRLLWHGATPDALKPVQKLLGRPLDLDPYVGLVEPVLGANMLAMCAAGVGGGSLVYQGMTLQPSRETFEETLPSGLDYDLMDRVHYPRVARMLKVATAPDSLVEHKNYAAARAFKTGAERAGHTVEKIPMPIDWSYAEAELRGEMKPSYTNGDCAMGVNNGGKHSVDVTYIAAAEATGLVDVRTHHDVTGVERTGDSWLVRVDVTDETGTVVEQKVITTDTLIMAAGSLNTTKLLVRAKALGHVPGLPDSLGQGWGTNGDRIYAWTNVEEDFGVQGGPVVYGSKDWSTPSSASTIIQASVPPVGVNLRSTMLVGFGVSEGRGRLTYNGATDSVDLYWPRSGDWPLHAQITRRMLDVVGRTGALIDTYLVAPSTWHPLGGAAMGEVCDLEGRVHEAPGLYVLDGALIPGSTGACNPSMTIAAVAERALDRIVAEDVGTVI